LVLLDGVGGLVVTIIEANWHNLFHSIFLIITGAFTSVLIDGAAAIGWRRLAGLRQRPWQYEVSECAIRLRTPLTDARFSWDVISTVRPHREFWLFRLSVRQIVPIPRAAFTAADAASIDSLVASRQPTSSVR